VSAFRVIPAIDLLGGRCVRLAQGDFERATRYDADPVDVARGFEAAGLRYLHLVDLDGAKAGRVVNADVVGKICAATTLVVDVGGGIKTDDDLARAFDAGAAQVNVGSVAVVDPARVRGWLERFGPERVVLSADARGGRIAVDGWRTVTAHDAVDFIAGWHAAGVTTVACTDVARDGMLGGASLDLYRAVREAVPGVRLVASGGVASTADLDALDNLGLDGAIVGRALYEGQITAGALAAWTPA
jgi:phosphoribosylformimino-5-aminoimidazole carboxamide ribotide isomerase